MAEDRFTLEMGPGDFRNLTAAQVRQLGSPVRGRPDAFSDAAGNVFDLSLSPTVSAPTGSWGPADVWVPNAAAAPPALFSTPVAAPAPTGADLSIQEQMNLHPHLRLPTWVEPELRGWGGQEVYREGEFKGLTPPQARQRAVADALAGRLSAPSEGIFSYPGPALGGGEEGQSDSSYSPPGWESPTTHDKIGFVLENLAGKNVTLENYSKANA